MRSEPGELSRYSDGLQAGRLGFDSRQGQDFSVSIASRPALGPTQSLIQWVSGALSPGVKRRGVNLTNQLHLVPMSRIVELYLHSPTRLRGIVLN
jgi:hypothetical protein